eukprot:1161136-Pelagomonas_calceolata.AAC.3
MHPFEIATARPNSTTHAPQAAALPVREGQVTCSQYGYLFGSGESACVGDQHEQGFQHVFQGWRPVCKVAGEYQHARL